MDGAMLFAELDGSECRACLCIDLSTIETAPGQEFVGIDDHLFEHVERALMEFKGQFGPAQPMGVIRLEIGVYGAPAGPVLAAEPGDGEGF